MPPVEIYTTPYCPYCLDAKALLKKKNVAFTEIDVSRDRELRAKMIAARQRRHAPCRRFSSARPMSAAATTSTRSRAPASSIRC